MLTQSPSEDWGKSRTRAAQRDTPETGAPVTTPAGGPRRFENRFPENKYEALVRQQSIPRLANGDQVNYPLISLRVFSVALQLTIIACVAYRFYELSEKLKTADPLPLEWSIGIVLVIFAGMLILVEAGPAIDAPRNFILMYFAILRPYLGKAVVYLVFGGILLTYHDGWALRDPNTDVFEKDSALMFSIIGMFVLSMSIVYCFIGCGLGSNYFPVE